MDPHIAEAFAKSTQLSVSLIHRMTSIANIFNCFNLSPDYERKRLPCSQGGQKRKRTQAEIFGQESERALIESIDQE